MNISMMKVVRSLLAGAALCAATLAPPVHAQAYPNRTITLIVAFGPAGVTDGLSRTVAKHLSERLKVPVIVENRPGANQMVGIQQLKNRPSDGYTLYTGTGSALSQNPGVRKDLAYDPLKDFVPVALLGLQAGVIAAAPGLPAGNLRELVAHAKANPGKLNFVSQGMGSAGHLAAELFMARAGVSMVHIPMKNDNEMGVELSEGRVDVGFMTPQFSIPLAKAGKLKILSALSVKPLPFLPELPALGAAGIAGLDGLDPFTFYGVVARAGTPPEIVNLLNETINAIVRSPEVTAQMRDTFRVEPKPESSEGFRKFVADELAKWSSIGDRIKIETH